MLYRIRKYSNSRQSNSPVKQSFTNRPNTSYVEGVVAAARLLDTTPMKLPDHYRVMQSRKRLYRGAKAASPNKQIPLFQLAELTNDTTQQHSYKAEEFSCDLNVLKQLDFDLELNYEIANGNEDVHFGNCLLGDFIKLEEKLKEETKNLDQETISNILKEYCVSFRGLLRSLKAREANDEAVMLEIIWRLVIKLVDSTLLQTQNQVLDLQEKAKENLKEMSKNHEKTVEIVRNENKLNESNLKNELHRKDSQISFLLDEKTKLQIQVKEKENMIEDLTEVNGRESSCQEMSKLFKKLNEYIKETETQQAKQAETLNSISNVMRVREELDKEAQKTNQEVQTSWSLKENPLPILDTPLLSQNPFFEKAYEGVTDVEVGEALRLCEQALAEANEETRFYKQLTKKAGASSVGVAVKSVEFEAHKGVLFSKLLAAPEPLPWAAEELVLKVNRLISQMEPRSGDQVAFYRVLDLVTSSFPLDKRSWVKILKKVQYSSQEWPELDTSLTVSLSKLVLAADKFKKGFKGMLEANDYKKQGTVSREMFVDWAVEKLNCWASAEELEIAYEFLGENPRISSIAQKFSSFRREFAWQLRVEKQEVLCELMQEWLRRQKEFEAGEPVFTFQEPKKKKTSR